jgi:hypothetical protein
MRWLRAETNQGGAINHRDKATIEVTWVGDKMVVTESGTAFVHKTYWTEDTTTWANVWTGTYKIDADVMHATLTLKDRKCSKTRSYSAAAAQPEPCDPIDKTIKLHCVYYETELQQPNHQPAEVEMHWQCSADAKLGNTPMPWVFGGKSRCLEATSSRAGTTYRRCP